MEKETIELVKKMIEDGNLSQEIAERYCPELKESEDERIMKEITDYLSTVDDKELIPYESWIAWLEKQGKIEKASYEIAEKEKREFVSDGFIKCYADFQDFKEGETYWLEYLGNDNYNVSLLGKTYHITPCQLYTIFKKQTWLEKQSEEKSIDMSIKEKAHQIAWETSKHYDPLLSKESWCEMAARDSANYVLGEIEKQLDEFTNFEDSIIVRRVIEQLEK